MKFSFVLLLSAVSSLVAATEDVAIDSDLYDGPAIPGMVDSPREGHYVDFGDTRRPFKFEINYNIPEKDGGAMDVLDLYNAEEISLEYTFTNNEDQEVNVAGVGGAFRDPATFEVLANLTDSAIGPINIPPRATETFIQRIAINILPKDYLFTPTLYIVYNNGLMMIGSRNQLVTVSDPKVSFFNPQFLFLELVLLGSLGIFGYFLYTTYGTKYISGVQPPKKAAKTAAASKTSGADASWLPEEHLAKKTVKKSKKAN